MLPGNTRNRFSQGKTTHAMSDLIPKELAELADPNYVPRDPEQASAELIRRARCQRWHTQCPTEYRSSDWAHPRLQPSAEQIKKVLGWQYGKRGLLLSGPTGRGKTRSIWALLKRLMCDEGRDVSYWRAVDWFNALQKFINYGQDDADGFIRDCSRRPLMVLDDLGQEALTGSRADWANAWLMALLDERLAQGMPMLVSTNLSADQIAAGSDDDGIRGAPLIRRLTELCEVVKFNAG